MNGNIQAITFDCYCTLIYPLREAGRGRGYEVYLKRQGLTREVWEHRILYELYEFYDAEYDAAMDENEKRRFWAAFTERLFETTRVRGDGAIEPEAHADGIRGVFGSEFFAVYGDVVPSLTRLKDRGLRLAVISNWPKGLDEFLKEYGIAPFFETILVSADIGIEKPAREIFDEARARLDLPAEKILHIGDLMEDDVIGATGAGFSAALIVRGDEPAPEGVDSIRSLAEIEDTLLTM